MERFEKILPNLPDNRKLLNEGVIEECILDLAQSYNSNEMSFAEEKGYSAVEIGSNQINLSFFEFLCRSRQCRTIFEIGTFTGMATTHFAKIDTVEQIVSIEKFDKFARVAASNFGQHGVEGKITLICGDAIDVLNQGRIEGDFDLLFIDGDKANYHNYFIKCLEISHQKSLFIIDDFFFHGDIFNAEPTTEKGAGVKQLVKYLLNHKDEFKVTVVPIGNGVGIVERI